MKIKLLFAVCLLITISCCTHRKATDYTVYITNTGNKYHTNACRYLGKSALPISLKDICTRGYGPCSECGPPNCQLPAVVKDSIVSHQKADLPMENKNAEETMMRCSGTTKAGKQCKRKTKDSDGRCFQHKKQQQD